MDKLYYTHIMEYHTEIEKSKELLLQAKHEIIPKHNARLKKLHTKEYIFYYSTYEMSK